VSLPKRHQYRYLVNQQGDSHETMRAALDFFAHVAERPLRPMGTAKPPLPPTEPSAQEKLE
jgi:hypothetical protein